MYFGKRRKKKRKKKPQLYIYIYIKVVIWRFIKERYIGEGGGEGKEFLLLTIIIIIFV